MRIILPVLPIEIFDANRLWLRVEAANVNTVTVGVGSWRIKHLDATMLTKGMLGHTRIEGISCEGLASKQFKLRLGYDQVKIGIKGAH